MNQSKHLERKVSEWSILYSMTYIVKSNNQPIELPAGRNRYFTFIHRGRTKEEGELGGIDFERGPREYKNKGIPLYSGVEVKPGTRYRIPNTAKELLIEKIME